MSVTPSTRFGLNQWGSGSDSFTRIQRNGDNTAVETLGAISAFGTLAQRGTKLPGQKRDRYYWASDQPRGQQLYYDDGTTWTLAGPGAGSSGSVTSAGPGGTANAGSSAAYAPIDHQHSTPGWASAAVDLSFTAGAAGSAATHARGDHRHGLPATVARTDTSQTFAGTQSFSEVRVGGQSAGRGLVGINSGAGPSAYTSTAELDHPAASVTFPSIAGRKYLILFTYTILQDGGNAETWLLRLKAGSTVLEEWARSGAAILGVVDTHMWVYEIVGTGSPNVCPSIRRASGSNSARLQNTLMVVIDIGT